MRKKSAIMASTIAVVLTTSVLVFALSNQAFAQPAGGALGVEQFVWGNIVSSGLHAGGGSASTTGQVLAGHEAQAGKVLAGEEGQFVAPHTGIYSISLDVRAGGPIKP